MDRAGMDYFLVWVRQRASLRAAANPAPGPVVKRKRGPPGRFTGLSVAEVQAEFFQAVGRTSDSTNVTYLIWKIREAEAGRIRVGPPRPRR